MPLVDRVVADGLARRGGCEIAQTFRPCFSSMSSAACDVRVVLGGAVDVEVVAPAGDLEAVVAPLGGQPAHLLERQVGPLAGEQGDRTRHGQLLVGWRGRPGPARWCVPRRVQRLSAAADASTAASTRCTCRPSANDGAGSRAGRDVGEQVDDLVGERVLVPEHVARRPPGADVRVVGLGDLDPVRNPRPRRPPRRRGTSSSFIASKSKARLPRLPLTSSRIAFFRPVANRVASKTPSTPPASRAVKIAASSTVTSPVPSSAAPPVAARPPDVDDSSGRCLTKVSVTALTPVIARPVTNWASVDDVRADVAERAGAGLVPLQPPHQRELRVDDPVLQVLRPHVAQLPEPALRRRAAGRARAPGPAGS